MDRTKKIVGIYCITNIQNNKKYVGYSTNIKKRWGQHRDVLRRGVCKNTHMQAAYNLYGFKSFVYSILEELPAGLTKQEYEKVETDWVLKFNSHKVEYGYNACLPGSYPLREEGENKTNPYKKTRNIICIDSVSGEVIKTESIIEAKELTGLKYEKMWEYCNYWNGKNRKRRSYKGWMFVYEDEYNQEFDYLNFKYTKQKSGKTWKDYSYNRRKSPEEIIPRTERNLKRVGIIAVNVITKEEREFPMIKGCSPEFSKMKIYKCINAPFMKYKHRGHYFKRAE